MIKQVRRKLPAHASAAIDPDEEEDEEDGEDDYVYQYRLGKIPPKSFDPKRLITEDDKVKNTFFAMKTYIREKKMVWFCLDFKQVHVKKYV